MGSGGKGGGDSAKPVKGAQFQPFTYSSLAGTAAGKKEGKRGYGFSQELAPEYEGIYQTGISQAQPFLSSYLQKVQEPVDRFGFDKSIDQATQEYFTQQQAALDPVFAQQRQQLQSDLFGSGRMGLMLAGETAGAGAGGMVQPDAFGLSRGQSQALQEAYAKSRAAAVGEQKQAFDQAQQQYALNQAAQQQEIANLLAGFGGAYGGAEQVIATEAGLIGRAAGLEEAVRRAAAGAANAGANLAQASGSSGGKGLIGDLATAGAKVYSVYNSPEMIAGREAAAAAAASGSDIKLKENIKKVGEQNGFNIYTWDWNDLAKSFGIENQPTRGVMAQEVMNVIPSAVKPHPVNGYLTVDYSKIGVTR